MAQLRAARRTPPRGSPQPHAASIAPQSPAAGPGGAAASPRAHRSNLGASNKCSLMSGGAGSVQSFIFTITVTPAVWKPVAAGLRCIK